VSTFILGITTEASAHRGRLAEGSALLWSAGSGEFKAVLIETTDPDAQLALMADWREAREHPLRGMAETMMADRLEHLRGKMVRYRAVDAGGTKFDALVTLARLDEIGPGDTIWTRATGTVRTARTLSDAEETTIVVAGTEPIVQAKHFLAALVRANGGAITESRIVTRDGERVGTEEWLAAA
jgi:hypothetical protein